MLFQLLIAVFAILIVLLCIKLVHIRRNEALLMREQARLQTFMDAIPLHASFKDTQLRYVGCNKAFEKFSKTKKEHLIGKTVFDIFSDGREAPVTELDTAFLQSPKKAIRYTTVLPDGNGKLRDYFVSKSKFFNIQGIVDGFVTMATDVTDFKNLERRLFKTNERLKHKNDHILSSMKYACQVQESILPEKESVLEAFNENIFVLLKPRDIVSGDFYWFAKKDRQLIVAAADCTGNGTPSALMTILGHSLLEHIIYEEEITRPDLILGYLDGKWRSSFQKRGVKNHVLDGMDISVCTIDPKLSQIQFAGARRPLCYIRDGQVHNIHGSRFSIGGRKVPHEKKFKLHTLSALKDDIFYIFTDGFPDQIGEQEKRRFMSHRFREFLQTIHHLPMKTQQVLLDSKLQSWQGSQIQTDDILVMGFKLP